MPIDSFVQVAPDGSGKQVDMAQTASAAGAIIYRQRAEIVGDAPASLQLLVELSMKQLAVLRAIYSVLANSSVTEEDFLNDVFN
jgi:hypothetical protein